MTIIDKINQTTENNHAIIETHRMTYYGLLDS